MKLLIFFLIILSLSNMLYAEVLPFSEELKNFKVLSLSENPEFKNIYEKMLNMTNHLLIPADGVTKISLAIVDDNFPNAAIIDLEKKGHVIVVSTGLLFLCENDDELALIIGHELEHLHEPNLKLSRLKLELAHRMVEAQVDTQSIMRRVQNKGYNPIKSKNIFIKLKKMSNTDSVSFTHASWDSRLNIIDAALTVLEREKGVVINSSSVKNEVIDRNALLQIINKKLDAVKFGFKKAQDQLTHLVNQMINNQIEPSQLEEDFIDVNKKIQELIADNAALDFFKYFDEFQYTNSKKKFATYWIADINFLFNSKTVNPRYAKFVDAISEKVINVFYIFYSDSSFLNGIRRNKNDPPEYFDEIISLKNLSARIKYQSDPTSLVTLDIDTLLVMMNDSNNKEEAISIFKLILEKYKKGEHRNFKIHEKWVETLKPVFTAWVITNKFKINWSHYYYEAFIVGEEIIPSMIGEYLDLNQLAIYDFENIVGFVKEQKASNKPIRSILIKLGFYRFKLKFDQREADTLSKLLSHDSKIQKLLLIMLTGNKVQSIPDVDTDESHFMIPFDKFSGNFFDFMKNTQLFGFDRITLSDYLFDHMNEKFNDEKLLLSFLKKIEISQYSGNVFLILNWHFYGEKNYDYSELATKYIINHYSDFNVNTVYDALRYSKKDLRNCQIYLKFKFQDGFKGNYLKLLPHEVLDQLSPSEFNEIKKIISSTEYIDYSNVIGFMLKKFPDDPFLNDENLIKKVALDDVKIKLIKHQLKNKIDYKKASVDEVLEVLNRLMPEPEIAKDVMLNEVMHEKLPNKFEVEKIRPLMFKIENLYNNPVALLYDLFFYAFQNTPKLEIAKNIVLILNDKPVTIKNLDEDNLQTIKNMDDLSKILALQAILDDSRGLLKDKESREIFYGAILGKNIHKPIYYELLDSYLKSIPSYQEKFVLSYMLVSTVRRQDEMSEGMILKKMLEAMGPPFGVRAGQILYASGLLPVEVAKHLEEFNAAFRPPSFISVHDKLQQVFTEEVELREKKGSASVNYTHVIVVNGKEYVVRLQREHLIGIVANENVVWEKVIKNLRNKFPKEAEMLDEIRAQAYENVGPDGADLNHARERDLYSTAERLYSAKTKSGYTMMASKPDFNLQKMVKPEYQTSVSIYEKYDHTPLEKLDSNTLRQELAESIVKKELENIFVHGEFDPDGHRGNWLIDQDRKLLVRIDYGQMIKLTSNELSTFKEIFPALFGLASFDENKMASLFIWPSGVDGVKATQIALSKVNWKSSDPLMKKLYEFRRHTRGAKLKPHFRASLFALMKLQSYKGFIDDARWKLIFGPYMTKSKILSKLIDCYGKLKLLLF